MSHERPKGDKNSWAWESREELITLSHQVAGGEAADCMMELVAGSLTQDIHVDKLIVSLENPPGVGKTVTVTVSDGTSTITVAIAGDTDQTGNSTTNNFDLDVSAEDLTVALTATAGTATGCATMIIIYHDVDL
ncbi:MAG: hypothetical protein V3V32_04445 [Dehalococcoidia bacterium]